jgi:phosphoglycolate phosphatase-like HAD superfamily hydrolase
MKEMNNHMDLDVDNLRKNGIELIHPDIERGRIRFALFDFDGTISLIREGWQGIMIPMMVEILEKTPKHEDRSTIEAVVKDFVTRLTGKQTIYQMMQLCEEIRLRGGEPNEPLAYKEMYNERLNRHIRQRILDLKSGDASPTEMMVPGTLEWLQILKKREVRCFLASGTDEKYVQAEAGMLSLTPFFSGIYGALDDLDKYSKKMVIDRILFENGLTGPEFVVFGDGFVEIADSKAVSGIAVGVASKEKTRHGIDDWKRGRLIAAGADLIIADFCCALSLEALLFDAN